MDRAPWGLYLWPGLPPMWRRGSWAGLAAAVAFAGLVNLAVATSLVWTELEPFTPPVRTMLWIAVGLTWLTSVAWGIRSDRRRLASTERLAQPDGCFSQAVEHYLQRDWYEAQRVLDGLLRARPRDIEARLMLAAVLRQAGRQGEAEAELDRLALLEDSRGWEFEIGRERQRLNEASAQDEGEPAETDHPIAQVKLAA